MSMSHRRRTVLVAFGIVLLSFCHGSANAQCVALCSKQDVNKRIEGNLIEFSQGKWTVVAPGPVRLTVYQEEFRPCPDLPRQCKNDGAPLPPDPNAKEELTFEGSGSISGGILPALVEGFAKENNSRIEVSANRAIFDLTGQGRTEPFMTIRLIGSGSDRAVPALVKGGAEVGMLSRDPTQDEIRQLVELRDRVVNDGHRAAGEEDVARVLALDAVVIVTSRNNPVQSMPLCDIANIFAGRTQTWPGSGKPISVLVRTANSGTFDTFRSLVLDACHVGLSPQAVQVHSNPDSDTAAYDELQTAVAADENAIGFAPLGLLKNTVKPLRIGSSCGIVDEPDYFRVKTEDYLLSRRLYLLTPRPLRRNAESLMIFLASENAQKIIAETKLSLDQRIEPVMQDGSFTLRRAFGATKRLSITYRFRTASEALDTKAWHDVRRLASYIQEYAPANNILIAGFADSRGDHASNCDLSKKRAKSVRDALIRTGASIDARRLVVKEYCEAFPVTCNDTAIGWQKNRRVEIWVDN